MINSSSYLFLNWINIHFSKEAVIFYDLIKRMYKGIIACSGL